jgi:hypothetical protein
MTDIIGTPRPVTAGLGLWEDQPKARAADPATSHDAAESARLNVRTGSARARLLLAHYDQWKNDAPFAHALDPHGLTDEEAAAYAGLSLTSEYATRCSELVNAGYLETTNRTRNGSSGQARVVRVITDAGREVARGLK